MSEFALVFSNLLAARVRSKNSDNSSSKPIPILEAAGKGLLPNHNLFALLFCSFGLAFPKARR
jgi:hypothetical protein